MVIPNTGPPWYQFSVRTLLLLTSCAAALCSLGVCTHWLVPAYVSTVVIIGGVLGRIVARVPLGLVLGSVYGAVFSLLAIVILIFLAFPIMVSWNLDTWEAVWWVAVLVGGIAGGIFGGHAARAI